MSKLYANEIVTLVQTAITALRLLGQDGAIAGLILEHDKYDEVKRFFGSEVSAYEVDGVILDPLCHNTFVVDKMLCLRGTK